MKMRQLAVSRSKPQRLRLARLQCSALERG